MVVDDGDDFLALLVLVAGIANAIPHFLATVFVPSPWSTLVSRCFSAARCRTLAINACHSDPSSAHLAKTRYTTGHSHFERFALSSGAHPQQRCIVPSVPARWLAGLLVHTRRSSGTAGMRFALVTAYTTHTRMVLPWRREEMPRAAEATFVGTCGGA